MNKIQQYLDIHVEWTKEVARLAPPNQDLPPLLSFADANNRIIMLPMPSGSNLSQWARGKLEDMGAVIYATVTPAHMVPLDQLEESEAKRLEESIVEHGTDHPDALPYRQECYVVTAGDRSGTLLSLFLVERAEDGRVAQLVECRESQGQWAGPMADLLMTRH